MGEPGAARTAAPWLLATGWLPGVVVLCCLSVADTYMGMLDSPLPPTPWTWTFLTLYLSWTLLVPVVGLTISLHRRQMLAALLHVGLLVGGGWLCYVGFNFIL